VTPKDDPTSAPELDKLKAETEKLSAENRKLTTEVSIASERQRLEWVRSIGAFITALVAIIGVFFTFSSQQRQLETQQQQLAQLAKQHSDELLIDILKQFGNESERLRLGSVASLETYLAPSYQRYRAQVATLLIRGIETEPSQSVRALIGHVIARNVSIETLFALVEQNHDLQARIDTKRTGINSFERSYAAKWLAFEEVETLPKGVQAEFRNLQWNISVLSQSINEQGTVVDLNLSNVILTHCPFRESPIRFLVQEKGDFVPTLTTTPLREGLIFRQVNFEGAIMCGLTLSECKFEGTNLDKTILVGTSFHKCTFDSRTSIAGFIWFGGPKELQAKHPPRWYGCNIDVEKFGPSYGPGGPLFNQPGPFFVDTKWKIQRLDHKVSDWWLSGEDGRSGK